MLLKFVFTQVSAKGYEQTLIKGKTPQYWIERNHRIPLINSLNSNQELQVLDILFLIFLSESEYLLLFNRKHCQVLGMSTSTLLI